MIGLLQRVTHAHVTVAGECVGAIERGLLVLIGVEQGDSSVRPTACSSGFSVIACFPIRRRE